MRHIRLRRGPEFDRIRAFLQAVDAFPPTDAVIVPPGDDASALRAAQGGAIVLSTDLSIEGVHFRREWMTWEAIGCRAASAGLSDLAAMAARPVGLLVSLAVPPELDERTLEELARGIGRALRRCGASLLGGDLSRSPGPVAIDVVAVGTASAPVRRDGARAGDEIWLTGSIGGSAAAIAAWSHGLEPDPRARRAFMDPVPRVPEALWLADRASLHALIDLSDGLAGDAGHVAAASGVRLELDAARLPLHAVLEEYVDRAAAVRLAVSGGEDYELLFAAAPGTIQPLAGEFRRTFDLRLTKIGRVSAGEGVAWHGTDALPPLPAGGFDHFAGNLVT